MRMVFVDLYPIKRQHLHTNMNTHKNKSVKTKGLKTSIKFKGLKGYKPHKSGPLLKIPSLSTHHGSGTGGAPSTSTPSTSRKKDEGLYDLEQQMILRLPPGPSMALRRDIQSGAMNLKDRLSIELSLDMRHSKLTYGGQVYSAKLLDLPCILESLKTVDKKTFYKTADISQMLLCTLDDDSDDDEQNITKKKDKEKKYQWNHGVTPSLKNVRKRRFRKTLKKKYQEQPDIEKEVKRLFRMDNEAIDVKWEVVIEEEKKNNMDNPETQVLAQGGVHAMLDMEGMADTTDGLDLDNIAIGQLAIFGELSSSSDEEEEEPDINIMDSGEESNSAMQRGENITAGLLDLNTDTNMSADGGDGDGELHLKLEELGRQLEDIKTKRMAEELELAVTTDTDPKKDQIHAKLNELIDEEIKKQNEYEILSSMLSNQG